MVMFMVSVGSCYVELKDLIGESKSDILDYVEVNDFNVNFKQGYFLEQKVGYFYD